MTQDNPLLDVGFAMPFDVLDAAQIKPAITALLEDARADLRKIIDVEGPRTYANTLGALDLAAERLSLAMTVVGHLESVATTEALRAAYTEIKPEVSAFYASIPLDSELWVALKSYAATDEAKALTGPRKRFLTKTMESFRRHGADLNPDDKAALEALSRSLAEQTNRFAQNVLDATADWDFTIRDEAGLAGLPESARLQARESAESKGQDGWRFTLQAPSVMAVLTYLDDETVREKVYTAYNGRGGHGQFSNRELIPQILKGRAEKARLLGYADFADLVLEDRMACTGAAAKQFVEDLDAKSRAAFAREREALQAFRREREGVDAPALKVWDIAYYAEKLRKARFDFDEEALRPYFAAERVLQGIFDIAGKLYGVSVAEHEGLPVWHQDVRCYALRDADDELLGAFYVDLYPRETKRGGAWMNGLLTGAVADGHAEPSLGLICANVTPPVAGKPATLTHREVQTLFHEFGHLLHHLFSRVEIRGLSGTNVAWDFVELPSQIMENWAWEKDALALFAHHVETGACIPDALFDKLNRARTFRAAASMRGQLGYADMDLKLHTEYQPETDGDLVTYARNIMQQYSTAPLPETWSMITGFGHLFSGAVGYAAGYYSYKWAEVLDADAFTRFAEAGIFDADVGASFRRDILERGNTEEPAALYRRFMGRDPQQAALLRRFGLLDEI